MICRNTIAVALIGALLAIAGGASIPRAEGPSQTIAAVRAVMMAEWDKPGARLNVDPVVAVADYAVAGWTHGENAGRALLRRQNGVWQVILCGGDPLKQSETLATAGVPGEVAVELAGRLAAAEAKLPASLLARFASFHGLVTMDGAAPSGHGQHHSAH